MGRTYPEERQRRAIEMKDAGVKAGHEEFYSTEFADNDPKQKTQLF